MAKPLKLRTVTLNDEHNQQVEILWALYGTGKNWFWRFPGLVTVGPFASEDEAIADAQAFVEGGAS